MAKPTRTASGRGLSRSSLASAKEKTAAALKEERLSGKTPKSLLSASGGNILFNENMLRRQKEESLLKEAKGLREKTSILQASGARMGRVMSAAKAKQKSK